MERRTLKIRNGIQIKSIINNSMILETRLPLTPKVVVVPLGDAQDLINNLGDLRIK